MPSPDLLELERLAAADFDQAQAAYDAEPSEANRSAYEAATWAFQAAVMRVVESGRDQP